MVHSELCGGTDYFADWKIYQLELHDKALKTHKRKQIQILQLQDGGDYFADWKIYQLM